MGIIFTKTRAKSKPQAIKETGPETEEYKRSLEPLYEAAQKASSVSEVSKLLEEVLRITQRLIPSCASSLLLINEKEGELYFQAAKKKEVHKLIQITISLNSGIANRVLCTSMPLMINDVTADQGFSKEIDKVTGFATKSIMAVPLFRGQKVIGILEVSNRADGHEFNEHDLAVLSGFAATEALILLVSMVATATHNIKRHQILIDWYKSMFETLIAAADNKDLYATGHSSRVKKYTMLAANALSLSPEELQNIEFGALLHDIGKLWIHDTVLRKPGPLTEEEWYMMRKHPLKGAHMLSGIPYLEDVREIVLYHHERYDGKGYPQGLKGEDIPMGARLVAVADAYDTMTTAHSYRDKMSNHTAIKQLIKGSGTQFCPVAIKAFVSVFGNSPEELTMETDDATEEPAETAVPELTEDEAAAKAINDAGLEAYEGDVTLMIASPDGAVQVKQFKQCLEKVENLKIVLEGWSENEGHLLVVSAQKPVALAHILNEMPVVEKVEKKHNNLAVTLKISPVKEILKHGLNLN